MDQLLTEEQTQLRESAARLCADRGGAKRARQLRSAGNDLDRDAWQAMREAGWVGILVPEAKGGVALGAVELAIVLEQIGRQVAMAPVLESAALARLLADAGTGAANEALAALLAGERLIVPALVADGWTFASAKTASTAPIPCFAASADEFLIAIETQGETVLCLLPRGAPGITAQAARNVDGSTSGMLNRDATPLDPARIVARGAEAKTLATRLGDLLALGSAVMLLGICETAFALALEHVKTRRQFGHPLGSFQALQHRLADNFVDLELNRSLLHRVCLAWDEGTAPPALVAAAKSRAARVATEVLRNALQLHGAIGYTEEHDIGVYWKAALALSARYGNALTQAAHFARLTAEEG
jgi:alkylation response protein AidB-like acyl-CoA dehydrogenase